MKIYCKGCGELLGRFYMDKKIRCKKCGGENRYKRGTGSIVFISKKTLNRTTASGMTFS